MCNIHLKVASLGLFVFYSEMLLESTTGLLVDWFELLQPEIVDSVPEIQEPLLFARKVVRQSGEARPVSGSAYLLALLTHQTNWANLNHCITWLLTSDDATQNKIQASSALDFLWACIHIPKIWQGRTFKAHQSLSEENVLCLPTNQICTLASYIVTEAHDITKSQCEDNTQEITLEGREKQSLEILQARLPLLLNCCHDNETAMDKLVAHLCDKMKLTDEKCSLYQSLLLELYLQAPLVIQSVQLPRTNLGNRLASANHTKVDALTHRLLLSLVDIQHQDKWKAKVTKANSACRKLAAVHPILMLRQLRMISVLCQGRTNVSFHEFRNRGLISFFLNVLGLMELLQPQLFKHDIAAFHFIVDAYFDVIKRYGVHKRPFEIMYSRFVVLLYEYNAHCPTNAQMILEKYATILNELSSVLPDLHQLKCLLAGITLTHTSKDQTDHPDNSFKAETAEEVFGFTSRDNTVSPTPMLGSKVHQIWGPAVITKFVDRISAHQDSEEMVDTLNDLDEQSTKMPQILQHFTPDLMRLMCSTSLDCRDMAFSLVIKLLRQHPSSSSKFLPAFLQCLDSPQHELVTSAFKHLPDFCLLCQESANIVLERAFGVSVDKKIDTTGIISETMQQLNMEILQS